jgi:hypothetical protein
MTDLELLKQYGEGQSQQAFAELVGRHLEWVYGVAARRGKSGDAGTRRAENGNPAGILSRLGVERPL